jgi:hypothetical protein
MFEYIESAGTQAAVGKQLPHPARNFSPEQVVLLDRFPVEPPLHVSQSPLRLYPKQSIIWKNHDRDRAGNMAGGIE